MGNVRIIVWMIANLKILGSFYNKHIAFLQQLKKKT